MRPFGNDITNIANNGNNNNNNNNKNDTGECMLKLASEEQHKTVSNVKSTIILTGTKEREKEEEREFGLGLGRLLSPKPNIDFGRLLILVVLRKRNSERSHRERMSQKGDVVFCTHHLHSRP